MEIVGAYRFSPIQRLVEENGIAGLHSSQLFDYQAFIAPYFESGIELGRSFVQPKYWGKKKPEISMARYWCLSGTTSAVPLFNGARFIKCLFTETCTCLFSAFLPVIFSSTGILS